jgi:hypothetical protein
MATVADLIGQAYGRIGKNPEGQTLPAHPTQVGLDAFNSLIDRLPDEGVGDTLALRRVTAAITVDGPSVLHVIATSAFTITLPEEPTDGYRVKIVDVGANFATHNITVARNGWLIAGSAADVTLSTNGQSKEYMFRADLGDWKDITRPLALTDSSPYPAAHDEGLSAMLALRILENAGGEPTASLVNAASEGKSRLQQQYIPDLTAEMPYAVRRSPSQIPNTRTRYMS